MGDYKHEAWPSYRYGPNGEAEIFEKEELVSKGWVDHPDKIKPAKDAKPASVDL